MPLIAKGSLPEKVEEENKGRQAHRDSPATAIKWRICQFALAVRE